MRNLEDELRGMYLAVTDSVREDDVPGLYEKRVRTRRSPFSALVPLAAATAVVIVIVTALAAPKLLSPTRPSAPALKSVPAVTPPFVVILNKPDALGNQGPFVIANATTGQVTARVPAPRNKATWSDAATTGDGRTFVLAAKPLENSACDTYLYTLRLSVSGTPLSLKPFSVPVVHENVVSITASADGGTVGFVADQCRNPDQVIGIIHNGGMKTWQEPYPVNVTSLSMSADGSLLAFCTYALGQGPQTQARLLETSAKPGSAAAASTTLYTYPSGTLLTKVVLSHDGTMAYFMWTIGQGSHSTTVAGYQTGPRGVRGRLFQDIMPMQEDLSWAGNQLFVWGGGADFLVDPATGKTTHLRPKWATTWQVYW